MADVGDLTIDITIDRKQLAQDFRATAALLDPEGAVTQESMRLTQADDYHKSVARREKLRRELDAALKEPNRGGHRLTTIQDQSKEIAELRRKLDLEVACHRTNCELLLEEQAKRLAAEQALRAAMTVVEKNKKDVRDMSNAFMWLHNLAKTHADPPAEPKRVPGMQSPADLFTRAGRISRMEFAEDGGEG